MFTGNGEILMMIVRLERQHDLAAFERRQRLGLFQDSELPGSGWRAWTAERLLALALRLDRRAGERLALHHA